MKLKNALVLVVLAGAVLAATAQGLSRYGDPVAAPAQLAPFGLVLKAWDASGLMLDNLVSGGDSGQGTMLLAGLALLAGIVRRSMRNNG